jgi:short-subunit dehydrogenase
MTMTTPSALGTALITGASSGIGAVYADRLARRGYDLIVVARDRQRLESIAGRLGAEAGVAVHVIQADLTAKADLALIEQRLRDDPSITMLVNNAGVGETGPVLGSNLDRLDTLFALNIVALTRLAVAAASGFVARGRGVVINVGSVLGLAPEMASGPYAGTKAYVLNFSQVMQRELSDTGVRVQAVLPGATRTEIWERIGADINAVPASMLMDAETLVDAALAGLDQGESITIPSLPDLADWQAFETARLALMPNLSRDRPADRYGV